VCLWLVDLVDSAQRGANTHHHPSITVRRVNMHEAKTQLSQLVSEAAAGQSFVICKAGRPMVQVTSIAEAVPHSRLGLLRGLCSVPDDFDRLL